MKTEKKSMTPEQLAELAKMDLRPVGEAKKRTDDLLRTMLNSPPDPKTVKKPSKRPKK